MPRKHAALGELASAARLLDVETERLDELTDPESRVPRRVELHEGIVDELFCGSSQCGVKLQLETDTHMTRETT